MTSTQSKQLGVGLSVIIICVLVFVADLATPLGVAAAVPYVLAVIISMAAESVAIPIATAVMGTVLTIVGFYASTEQGVAWMVLANRGLALGVIWIATVLGLAHKRVADALRVSNTRTQAVMDTAHDGIIVISEAGLIESFNRAAETLFGYRASDVVGENVAILMPAPHRHGHDGYIKRYLDGGERRVIGIGREVPGQRSDGTIFPMRLAVSEVIIKGRRSFTGIVHDVTELREAEESARQDPLTLLPNRRAFDAILSGALDKFGAALLLIDIDHFKQVNDDLGHQKGDETLVKLAEGLAAVVRASDRGTCARIGGDEFAVILPGTSIETAEDVGRRILSQVAPTLAAIHPNCGLSVGAAVAPTGAAARTLVREADQALYRAKDTRGAVSR